VKTTATIHVPAIKITVPLSASALPRDLVSAEGPAGEPVIDVVLEGAGLALRAKINGKNYRKLLKMIADNGADNVSVALQGVVREPIAKGGPFLLEGAGFQSAIKTPKPIDG
jgi:hypothetical protein